MRRNAIPQCQAMRLQNLANALFEPQFRPVPFWLDTLCIPLERHARNKAITAMKRIYKQASKVLVLDSSCLEVSTSCTDATELVMRIRTSTWGRRLWTFQEACLAQRLVYQFADRAVSHAELEQMSIEECCKSDTHVRELMKTRNGMDLKVFRDQFPMLGRTLARRMSVNPVIESGLRWIVTQEGHGYHFRPSNLFNCLRYRWTSRLADETICLAGICDRPVQPLLTFESPEERMRSFLLSFETLPQDILYVEAPRSTLAGCKWMPLTFLGGVTTANMDDRLTPASPSMSGLTPSSEGMLLHFDNKLRNTPEPSRYLPPGVLAFVRYKNDIYEIEDSDESEINLASSQTWAFAAR